ARLNGDALYSGVPRAAGVFARMEADTTSCSELGIEAMPGDVGDGGEQAHAIELKVSRSDPRVRSRHELVAAHRQQAQGDEFLKLLYQPIDVTDLPLAVATYATRGEGGSLNLLLSAEIGAAAALSGPVQWG